MQANLLFLKKSIRLCILTGEDLSMKMIQPDSSCGAIRFLETWVRLYITNMIGLLEKLLMKKLSSFVQQKIKSFSAKFRNLIERKLFNKTRRRSKLKKNISQLKSSSQEKKICFQNISKNTQSREDLPLQQIKDKAFFFILKRSFIMLLESWKESI